MIVLRALESAKHAIKVMYENADWSNGNTHPDYPGGDDEGAWMMMNFVERELKLLDEAIECYRTQAQKRLDEEPQPPGTSTSTTTQS